MTTTSPTAARIATVSAGMAAYTQPLEALAQTAPVWTSGNHTLDALMTLTYTVPTLRLLACGVRPILPRDLKNTLNPSPDAYLARFNEWTGKVDGKISHIRDLKKIF